MILENKQLYKSYLREFSYPNETNYKNAVHNFFSEEASINVVHPINKIQGSQGYIDKVLKLKELLPYYGWWKKLINF